MTCFERLQRFFNPCPCEWSWCPTNRTITTGELRGASQLLQSMLGATNVAPGRCFLGMPIERKRRHFRAKKKVKSKGWCRWLDHVRYVIQWQCDMIWFHSARDMTWLNMLFVTNVLLMASWENAKRFSLVVSLMSNRQNKTCNQQTWRLALAWMYEVKKMKDTSARITSWEDF